MDEIRLEFTCIYTRNYNLLLKVKAAGEYQPEVIDQLRHLIAKEKKDKLEQVLEDYSLNDDGKDKINVS